MNRLFREVIFTNELGGNAQLIYRFSDPDGVRTGKSGYSFGICQFDTQNNPNALLCLRECGFTTDEIRQIKQQTGDIRPLNAKLTPDVVDRWDAAQLVECLNTPLRLCQSLGITLTNEAKLHLGDYHNQFYMSKGGKMHSFLMRLGNVIAEDIRAFKLTLPWGIKRPDDVHRRFNNIRRICR